MEAACSLSCLVRVGEAAALTLIASGESQFKAALGGQLVVLEGPGRQGPPSRSRRPRSHT